MRSPMRIFAEEAIEIAFIDDVKAHLIPPKNEAPAAGAAAAKPAAAPLLGATANW